MNSKIHTTKTPETIRLYQEKAKSIELMARKDLMLVSPGSVEPGKPLTPMQLAAWHVGRMKSGIISASTYRQYKACLITAFQTMASEHEESGDAVEYLADTTYSPDTRLNVKRTSARKSKSITFDDMVKLCDWLNAHRGKFNYLSSMWLTCAYHVGLRPCEWEHASLVKHEGVLSVRAVNAKRTNGRAHGELRHVPIEHLDQYSKETIIAFIHLLAIEMEMMPFVDIKSRCRMTIYRASRLCFDRRHKGISMYTMRHQFSANTKATLSLRETGALMGHKVGDTSKINYAPARAGHHITGLHAFKSEVERVTPPTINPFSKNKNVNEEVL